MSDTAICVVRLDVLPDAEIASAADRVELFLRSRGVIGDPTQDGWAPGPAYRTVLAAEVEPWYADHGGVLRMDRLDWTHVTVSRAWRDYFAVEAFEAPLCPRCGAKANPDDCHAGLEGWWGGVEPTLTCANCGTASLQGDWIGDRANAFGAPGVTFNNWEELDPEFVAELRAQLGGRTQVVWQHT